jgi:hypothetical protein
MMHDFCQQIALSEIKAGQTILIKCSKITLIFRTDADYMIGTVSAVFDAGEPLGVQVDIGNKTQWWRWIPSLDGGSAFVK